MRGGAQTTKPIAPLAPVNTSYFGGWESPKLLQTEAAESRIASKKGVTMKEARQIVRTLSPGTISELSGADLGGFRVRKNTVSDCVGRQGGLGDQELLMDTDSFCLRLIGYKEVEFLDIRPRDVSDYCELNDTTVPDHSTYDELSRADVGKVISNIQSSRHRRSPDIYAEIGELWMACKEVAVWHMHPSVAMFRKMCWILDVKSLTGEDGREGGKDIYLGNLRSQEALEDASVALVSKLMKSKGLDLLQLFLHNYHGWPKSVAHACVIVSEYRDNTHKIYLYDPSGIIAKDGDLYLYIIAELRKHQVPGETYEYMTEAHESGEYSIQLGPTCVLYSWKLFFLLTLNRDKIEGGSLSCINLINYLREQSNSKDKQLVGTLFSMMHYNQLGLVGLKSTPPDYEDYMITISSLNNSICDTLESLGCSLSDSMRLPMVHPEPEPSRAGGAGAGLEGKFKEHLNDLLESDKESDEEVSGESAGQKRTSPHQ